MEFNVRYEVNDLHRRRFAAVGAKTDSEIEGILMQAAQDHVEGLLEDAASTQFDMEREPGRALHVSAFGDVAKEMPLQEALAMSRSVRDGSEVWTVNRENRWDWEREAFVPCSDWPAIPVSA